MFRYFIFDLDGTIAYTLDDLTNGINMMLDHFCLPRIDKEHALLSINNGVRKFVYRCLPDGMGDDPEFFEEALAVYKAFYKENCLVTTRPYPHVVEGLKYLKDKGAKMAVFSNKQHEGTVKIVEALFPNTFDVVLGGQNGFAHKPEPDGAIYIAEQFGAKPSEIAFVGDSDVDMTTAKNAGMHPIGVSWGYRPPSLLTELGAERIISDLESFKALVD